MAAKMLRLSVVFLAGLLSSSLPGWGWSGEPALKVVHPEGSPVRITAAELVGGNAGAAALLSFKFRMTNSSPDLLRSLEMVANVYSSDGQLKGFHGFTLKASLAPGEERFFLYKTGLYTVDPGDRIEVSPVSIAGARSQWTFDLPGISEEGAEKSSSLDLFGPVAKTEELCETRCATREESCSSKCTCGMAEFTCSCGGGTIFYSCKCQMCR